MFKSSKKCIPTTHDMTCACDWFYDSCHPWIPSKEIQIFKVIFWNFFLFLIPDISRFTWWLAIRLTFTKDHCAPPPLDHYPHLTALRVTLKSESGPFPFPRTLVQSECLPHAPPEYTVLAASHWSPGWRKNILADIRRRYFFARSWRGTPLMVLTRVKATPCGAFIGPNLTNNLPLSRSLFFSLGGFLCEFLTDFRFFFCAFRVGLRGMTENLRPNIPSPFREPQAMAGCVSELTRTNSDSSAITADTSKEPSRHCGNARTVNFEIFNFF